jgi:hypothetical protein
MGFGILRLLFPQLVIPLSPANICCENSSQMLVEFG